MKNYFLNTEQYEKIKYLEPQLLTAYKSQFIRNTSANDFELLKSIYVSITDSQDVFKLQCSSCVLSLYSKMGALYFEYLRWMENHPNDFYNFNSFPEFKVEPVELLPEFKVEYLIEEVEPIIEPIIEPVEPEPIIEPIIKSEPIVKLVKLKAQPVKRIINKVKTNGNTSKKGKSTKN